MTGDIAKRTVSSEPQPINAALDYASCSWPVFLSLEWTSTKEPADGQRSSPRHPRCCRDP
jgi:hypothetical protein